MNAATLERILSCQSLPSLPAVALRVIELTQDQNVKLAELAATIQNDQGLAAKILKTVNSSFYALRSPCANINKALVMLGLGPVKALALGFSLVGAIPPVGQGFDYVGYWRRGMYTAAGAKVVADAAGKRFADEAFLAGLLQDIGVMACFLALGEDYLEAMTASGADHARLAKIELERFEVQHAEIGAMLCQRWKLPDELVMPVRYHERPTAAPVEYADICRCVALGNLVHDVLTSGDPRAALNRLYARGLQWFKLDAGAVDAIVRRAGEGARELSQLFRIDTGPFVSADAILDEAKKRRDEVIAQDPTAMDPCLAESEPGSFKGLLADDGLDPLTGALARSAFDRLVKDAFHAVRTMNASACLLQVGLDGYGAFRASSGDGAADDAVVALAAALTRAFEPAGAHVCRLSNDVFAIILTNVPAPSVMSTLDGARAAYDGPGRPTISAGIALAGSASDAQSPVDLVIGATRALQAARLKGGNQVQRHQAAA